jgi:cell fate (sporulation/competence/biofilm development) regulator YlbF (YheA/YmcA/DUF963 family)
MSQNEVINYLCNSIKYLQDFQNEIKEKNRISDFEEQNKTTQQRIDECTQRLTRDIEDLITLLSQKYNGNPC